MNFCVAILILKMEAKHFLHIMLIISRKVKTIEMHKKICAVYGEGAVSDQTCRKWFGKFMLEISHWTMLQGEVNKLKLIVIISNH